MSGKTTDIRILHISDTHLSGDGSLHRGVVDTAARLDEALDHAASGEPCHVIIHSGDISNDGTEESYRLAAEKIDHLASTWQAPVLWTSGNHDNRRALRKTFAYPGMPDDSILTVAEIPHLRIIGVDTSVPQAGYGYLGQQIQWALDYLADDRPSILFLHHPPATPPTLLHEALRLSDAQDLQAALEAAPIKPVAILGGHYHMAMQEHIAGIPVYVAPAIANKTSLQRGYTYECAVDTSGYQVVTLRVWEGETARAESFVNVVTTHGEGSTTEVFHFTPDEVVEIGQSAGRPGWKPNISEEK